MPAASPRIGKILEKALRDLGRQLRDRRKQLGVSAVTTAEAAGMSRVTLHRIERGEASVAMGAYLSVAVALGLELALVDPQLQKGGGVPKLPKTVRLTDYPTLKQLAWQLKGAQTLTPQEALDLYERNWRHIDFKAMNARELDFLEALLSAHGRRRSLV